MKKWMVSLVTATVIALAMLFLLSVLTYIFKWQADVAHIGIVITYIITGWTGGVVLKRFSEKERLGGHMLEAGLFGLLFMLFMYVVACFFEEEILLISENGYVIWILIVGSTALGRIL